MKRLFCLILGLPAAVVALLLWWLLLWCFFLLAMAGAADRPATSIPAASMATNFARRVMPLPFLTRD